MSAPPRQAVRDAADQVHRAIEPGSCPASGPQKKRAMSTLENDGNLDRATEIEGYKVLPPCVIYGKIGQGGMGAVYRGRHLNLDIDVAV